MAAAVTPRMEALTALDGGSTIALLEAIQRRVLWLATAIVQHANRRPSVDGLKVGGHQASCASVVSLLTALYFGYLRPGDRIAVKPHASPVFHAIRYLLGHPDRRYLPTLRAFGGLQAYPSRTKDPDGVDFSTGSVGLGAAAPVFAALTHRYVHQHFGPLPPRRFVALVGDAELDEGNVWEAVYEDHLRDLGNVLWVVDLNRQSLDRVIPGIRAGQLQRMFRDNGWHVLEAKYGRRLEACFARPGGQAVRKRIDDLSNEAYQAMIRLPGAELRREFAACPDGEIIQAALADVPDEALAALLSDLGGHDLTKLLACFAAADQHTDAPTVLFAYTMKGWGLPFAGDPRNHSALLTEDQFEALRHALDVPPDDWAAFDPESPEGRLCAATAARLRAGPTITSSSAPTTSLTTDTATGDAGTTISGGDGRAAAGATARMLMEVPQALDARRPRAGERLSTQEAFGRLLVNLRDLPGVGDRLVTVSPDVAVSTGLGAWVNRAGVYASTPRPNPEPRSLLRWQPGPSGQHIELGISEMNLFLLLGQLGLSQELVGELLLPVGTVYDPFVLRGMDALVYALYNGAKFVVVGTPSGITLGPEGGAHQSTVTPGLGIMLPNLIAYEPAFALGVEWTLLEGLRQCYNRTGGAATYLRLSTRPVDQALLEPALRRLGEAALRRQVLAGGYRLVDRREAAPHLPVDEAVQIAVAGALVPEAVAAARHLHGEGVAANVLVITSADRLYHAFRAGRHRALVAPDLLDDAGPVAELVLPEERRAPFVTVLDGTSHALAFLGSIYGVPVVPLGVDAFGQSGALPDLYAAYGIDTHHIVAAAYVALDLAQSGQ